VAAGAGVLIPLFISRDPELRLWRIAQLVILPPGLMLCVYLPPTALMIFRLVLTVMALLVAPSIVHTLTAGMFNAMDPQDWTSENEEIALRPIRQLVAKGQPMQALTDLEELLAKHKPTYEARMLHAKLLSQLGRANETEAALLSLIDLCRTTEQQLMVMEQIASLENPHQPSPKPSGHGARRIQIRHELVLFQTSGGPSALHKEIQSGAYEVEEISHGNRRWLKLKGEDWGNAEMCWEAVRSTERPVGARPGKSLLRRIARMHQAIGAAFKRKPRLHLQAEAQKLLQEASQLIRCNDWPGALPLLQKASALDPDRYEIAYRWVQAVRQTANEGAAAQAVRKVLKQSQWTDSEKAMLRQLTNRA
jgi:thioredoxin-like negative regulator of GroEL